MLLLIKYYIYSKYYKKSFINTYYYIIVNIKYLENILILRLLIEFLDRVLLLYFTLIFYYNKSRIALKGYREVFYRILLI